MSESVDLSIVIPCYNEEQRIPGFVISWEKFIRVESDRFFKTYPSVEIIFINDGSRDQTENLLKQVVPQLSNGTVIARFESLSMNQGKGAAVRRGFQL
ncbi:MAG: putative glycosyl transferase, partial [Bacteriovoracaceae bacterium]|nr:putative glycosyl transferase [Bacteriovoracaceae bacterium]